MSTEIPVLSLNVVWFRFVWRENGGNDEGWLNWSKEEGGEGGGWGEWRKLGGTKSDQIGPGTRRIDKQHCIVGSREEDGA